MSTLRTMSTTKLLQWWKDCDSKTRVKIFGGAWTLDELLGMFSIEDIVCKIENYEDEKQFEKLQKENHESLLKILDIKLKESLVNYYLTLQSNDIHDYRTASPEQIHEFDKMITECADVIEKIAKENKYVVREED